MSPKRSRILKQALTSLLSARCCLRFHKSGFSWFLKFFHLFFAIFSSLVHTFYDLYQLYAKLSSFKDFRADLDFKLHKKSATGQHALRDWFLFAGQCYIIQRYILCSVNISSAVFLLRCNYVCNKDLVVITWWPRGSAFLPGNSKACLFLDLKHSLSCFWILPTKKN